VHSTPDPPDASCRPASTEEPVELAQALITTRQHVSPKRLAAPGPDRVQFDLMLRAAAAAPDHGLLRPWRFIVVPPARRGLLAEVFAQALVDRDAAATPDQVRAARDKAHRAPLLMLAVARLGAAEPDIPPVERLVSTGAAIQNLLLSAHAMGFGAGLTSGQALRSPRLRELFALEAGEEAVCFVNVGTVTRGKAARRHPDPSEFVSEL
jgi:nitroreductase